MAVASRMAGRRTPSAGFSLARRSSIRFGPGVRPDEVVLQDGLEVSLLPDLLEEREPHLGIVDRHVARPQDGPALAFPVRRPQTRRQEAERPAGPLEVGDGRPALPHQVDEGWVERIGRPDAVPQRQAVFLGLLPLGVALGVGPPHLGDGFLECVGGRTLRRSPLGSLASSRRWMTDRISFPSTGSRRWSLRGGQVIDGLEQVHVLERLRLLDWSENTRAVLGVLSAAAISALDEEHDLVAQVRIADPDAARPDQEFEHFVEKNQVWVVAEERHELVGARIDPALIVLAAGVRSPSAPPSDTQSNPRSPGLNSGLRIFLPVGRIEELAVEYSGPHRSGLG